LPGETIEGWVTAEITPYPRPLRAVHHSNVHHLVDSFTIESVNSLENWLDIQYGPPTAQFVLALVEYPSGPVSRWGHLRWRDIEIVLRSPQEWLVQAQGDAPSETPELRHLVDDLANAALTQGWQPAGRGRTWCSLRFRQQYACLNDALRWK
jgi:hypothetical protein